MHLRLRPLLLATGALLLTAATASAQFIDVVTEAPVTLQPTLTVMTITSSVTATGSTRTAKTTVTKLTQEKIIDDLRASGIIEDTTSAGWSLVAVNVAAADISRLNASFLLYAAKASQRVKIPSSKFDSFAFGSVEQYTERHQGQYIYSSKGTMTNYVAYNYRPSFTLVGQGSGVVQVNEAQSAGFATISFSSKNFAEGHEVFFLGVSSTRVTTQGGFTGTLQVGSTDPTDIKGLIDLTINIGAAKLVPATLYPDAPSF